MVKILKKWKKCPRCKGAENIHTVSPAGEVQPCTLCNGTGKIRRTLTLKGGKK